MRFSRALTAAVVALTAAVTAVVGLAATPWTAPAGAADRALWKLADPRLDEASGIGVGLRNPKVVYAQNDSGDSARLFALDASTGRTRAVITVPGATNIDWEDLAVAPDARNVDSVWLADIGDNNEQRRTIQIYRVDEPSLAGADVITNPPEVWNLRYPDRAHNAEAIAIDHRRNAAYLVTKSLSGTAQVFTTALSSQGGRPQTLVQLGQIQLALTGTPGGPNLFGQLTITGAAMSPDGAMFVVRTYTDAYLWRVTSTLKAALATQPVRIALPAQPLGEGITFDGPNLLTDSEGVGSTVYQVSNPDVGASSSPANPGPDSVTRSPASSAAGGDSVALASGRSGSRLWIYAVALGLLGAGGLVWRSARRRR